MVICILLAKVEKHTSRSTSRSTGMSTSMSELRKEMFYVCSLFEFSSIQTVWLSLFQSSFFKLEVPSPLLRRRSAPMFFGPFQKTSSLHLSTVLFCFCHILPLSNPILSTISLSKRRKYRLYTRYISKDIYLYIIHV